MYVRIYSLVSVFLVVFYGFVGLTGTSLHYLVDSLLNEGQTVVPVRSNGTKSVSYLHSHAPDHHIHFHQSHHHLDDTSTKQKIDTDYNELTAVVKTAANCHSDHVCPLLTIVSTLKLGLGISFCAAFDFDELCRPLSLVSCSYFFELTSCHLARGPPLV